MSVDKKLSIAKTITTIKVRMPLSNTTMSKTILIKAKHKSIAMLFDENFWKSFYGVPESKSGDPNKQANRG